VWQGHFAFFAGAFGEVADDDQHLYHRGEPLEICSKTRCVLESNPYASHFAILNRAGQTADGEAASCDPNGGCC
jgi:hypothetical protein